MSVLLRAAVVCLLATACANSSLSTTALSPPSDLPPAKDGVADSSPAVGVPPRRAAEQAPPEADAVALLLLEEPVESAHPYPANADRSYVVYAPDDARELRLYFSWLDLEEGYDALYLSDDGGDVVQALSGQGYGWSATVPGPVARLQLESDGSVQGWGFEIAAVEYRLAARAAGGRWVRVPLAAPLASAQPYANDTAATFTALGPEEARAVRLVFDDFALESGYDWVHVANGDGRRVQSHSGELGPFTTPWVDGPEIRLDFVSDGSITADGFRASALEAWLPEGGSVGGAGEGEPCEQDLDCAEGLVCAGATAGYGLCNPAWMRGTFTWQGGPATIPDADEAGLVVDLEVDGLASVSTDVVVDLEIRHSWQGDLRVTLENPSGTVSVLHDRTGEGTDDVIVDGPVSGFPGDESVNGTWRLRVVDFEPKDVGTLERFALTLTSRYD